MLWILHFAFNSCFVYSIGWAKCYPGWFSPPIPASMSSFLHVSKIFAQGNIVVFAICRSFSKITTRNQLRCRVSSTMRLFTPDVQCTSKSWWLEQPFWSVNGRSFQHGASQDAWRSSHLMPRWTPFSVCITLTIFYIKSETLPCTIYTSDHKI